MLQIIKVYRIYLKMIHVSIRNWVDRIAKLSHHQKISTIVPVLFFSTFVYAQEIPIGTWRAHISYNSINSMALGGNQIFGAASGGVMVLDRTDNSISSYTRLNGLTSTDITSIAFHPATNQLLIAYADGKIDIVKGNLVKSLDPTQTTSITGSKRVNHISVKTNLAYCSTDYGVVVIDLVSAEIKETWRDLGVDGATLKINQTAFRNDSIFLATAQGVLAGDQDDNLLDYNKWKRFNTGDFNGNISWIAMFNAMIYATVNTIGLYRYENGNWAKEPFLTNTTFQSLQASLNNLLICESGRLWKLNSANTLSQVTDALISKAQTALEDNDNKLWIGDGYNGVVTNVNGAFQQYLPNGPSNSSIFRMTYAEGSMIGLGGGYSTTFQALGNTGLIDKFENGIWFTSTSGMKDLTDIVVIDEKRYVSSFGYGVEERMSTTSEIIYDNTNSPLVNLNPPGKFTNITAVENSSQGIWVANYGTPQSLHLLKTNNTWESFTASVTPGRYPSDLLTDYSKNVWMVVNPAQGGGLYVYNRDDNAFAYISELNGSGALPSKSVRSIVKDRDGLVWVGTDIGVCYFYDPSEDAIKPIFENRFLLRDDKVTALAVDGGNRKWMGTERGVWLFNPTGEELIYNFTTANSPLLSNVILDIEVHEKSGEVFFVTDKGVVSFRSDATTSTSTFETIKIFPNPVTQNFNGTVGISGLATDAVVKITDISGKLVWQTKANGGTATWNVHDYNGRRAATGVYVVFAVLPDGSESVAGKIAVID